MVVLCIWFGNVSGASRILALLADKEKQKWKKEKFGAYCVTRYEYLWLKWTFLLNVTKSNRSNRAGRKRDKCLRNAVMKFSLHLGLCQYRCKARAQTSNKMICRGQNWLWPLFWNTEPCALVDMQVYQHCEQTLCLQSQGRHNGPKQRVERRPTRSLW